MLPLPVSFPLAGKSPEPSSRCKSDKRMTKSLHRKVRQDIREGPAFVLVNIFVVWYDWFVPESQTTREGGREATGLLEGRSQGFRVPRSK
jgi:hypothetical protein